MNENIDIIEKTESNIIKHLVIAGGGPYACYIYYGILKESQKQGLWDIKNIQSIYGTSAGAILAVLLSLKYSWETMDNYVIKRPWQNVFKLDLNNIYQCIINKGIFQKSSIYESFSPLFKALDISIDITILEFYKITNIELFLFATELDKLNPIMFSHKTYPDWKIMDALYASLCVPILFSPLEIENENNIKKTYIDGFFCMNYPLYVCIQNGNIHSEILGIKPSVNNNIEYEIEESSSFFTQYFNTLFSNSLFSYLYEIFMNLLTKCNMDTTNEIVMYEFTISISMNILKMLKLSNSIQEREYAIEEGVLFIKKWKCHQEIQKKYKK